MPEELVQSRIIERKPEIQQILSEFKSTTNLRFILDKDHFAVNPEMKTPITDAQVLEELKKYPTVLERLKTSSQAEKDELFADVRKNLRREGIGGFRITARTLAEMNETLPGIIDIIKQSSGKIVILGNGLSAGAKEILELFDTDHQPEVVITDLFDYESFSLDLQRLEFLFKQKNLEFPLEYQEYLQQCQVILDLIHAGKIKSVTFKVGTDQPPLITQNADLVINSLGPPGSTLEAQLSLLKKKGVLVTGWTRDRVNDTKTFSQSGLYNDDDQLLGLRIQKVS